jgi:simple sugar transport system ATP-binding protein
VSAAPPPALELRGITKRFGAVLANDGVSLTAEAGEVHGIVGENGAGKSTLMGVLYGAYQAELGTILLDGHPVALRDSGAAIRAGIAMVHQHFTLVDPLTVLENVVLGLEGGPMLRGGLAQARAELGRIERDYRLQVNPDAVVGDLPVGARQRVEILKALYRGARVLILDEPTAVLTPQEADELFRILGTLRREGRTVLLVTHKLREVMAVTDQVTVLRAGRVVACRNTRDTNPAELGELMIGRRLAAPAAKRDHPTGEVVLEAKGVTVRDGAGRSLLDDVSFNLRRGEIVGVAGVAGNGQGELLEALSAMRPPDAGTIRLRGETVFPGSRFTPRALRRTGVAHVPEDRLRTGLVPGAPAMEAAILGYQDDQAWRRGPLLDWRAVERDTLAWMRGHDVRPANPRLRADGFSGGNQQKLILARELEHRPEILLVGQPTRGVDVGGISLIHERLLAMREAGGAVLLVSVELDEILHLADRILVMAGGRIVGEMAARDADERRIGLLMAGHGMNGVEAA